MIHRHNIAIDIKDFLYVDNNHFHNYHSQFPSLPNFFSRHEYQRPTLLASSDFFDVISSSDTKSVNHLTIVESMTHHRLYETKCMNKTDRYLLQYLGRLIY